MAITDGLIVRVQPVAGDTAIKNLVDNSTFTGTGTPTLVDEGAEKAWQISSGTLLQNAINTVMSNVDGGGKTIVIRLKMTNFGTLSEQRFAGIKELPGTTLGTAGGPQFYRDSSTSRIRARSGTLMVNANSLTFLNTIVTLVYTPTVLSGDNNDVGKMWWNRTDRVGDAADTTSGTNSTWLTKTFTDCFIGASDSAQYNLLDFLVYDRQITEAEASALTTGANGLRTQIPAPSATTPITFTGTIPNQTFQQGDVVNVPLASYFSGTQTPFTFAGSVTPITGTGLSINSSGSIVGTATTGSYTGLTITGTDASSNTATSNAFNVTVNAATPVSFSGTVPTQSATVGSPLTVNLSSYFSGSLTPFSYSLAFGDLTGTGLSLNTSTGVISGTPTSAGTISLQVRATDTGTNTAVTNLFDISVSATGTPVSFSGTIPAISGTQNSAITPVDTSTYFSGTLTPFTYSLFSGTLPSGVTLNSSTGIISGTPTVSFTGNIVVRATDSGSNTADSNSIAINIAAASADGVLTSNKFSNNTGQLLANLTGLTVYIYNKSTGALIVSKTSETTDANGICVVSDALIVSGTQYVVVYTNGTDYGIEVLTAT